LIKRKTKFTIYIW